ncbi:MAG: proline iminopeptidase-family hydrolase [Nitrospiraceae bacterium]|nr:proline iminopeptidase-family hydrolase [Nitrospiraceae bacterium]
MTPEGKNCIEGYVPVPGGPVWYRIAGAGKKGVPLLVLHGGPGTPHDYLEPLEVLADDRPVIFYDQLGCGNSGHPGDTSLWRVERFVEELHAVRSFLALERLYLLGQSWGTMLAVRYLFSPAAAGVAGLVLSGPFLSASRWIADQRAWLAEMPEDIRRAVREAEATGDFDNPSYAGAMAAFYSEHLCRLDPWPDCLNRSFEKMSMPVYLTMWGPSEFTCTGLLKDAEAADLLGDISVPTLFTCGRYDEARPETTAYYQGLVPGSRMAVFENASHEHHLEQPNGYLAAVREFLRPE